MTINSLPVYRSRMIDSQITTSCHLWPQCCCEEDCEQERRKIERYRRLTSGPAVTCMIAAAPPAAEPSAWLVTWVRDKEEWVEAFANEVTAADTAKRYGGTITACYEAPPAEEVAIKPHGLTIAALQAAHVERQEEWCPEQKPDLSFRGNEMAGEVGEACNVIKKLERERQGWRGSRATKEQLAEELADVIHTAVLCAITAGIDLEQAVAAKFNTTSEKNGLSSHIRSALVSATASLPDGWVAVPEEPTLEWAHDMATRWQGQSETPRCEAPSDYDITLCFERIKLAIATRPPLPAQATGDSQDAAVEGGD